MLPGKYWYWKSNQSRHSCLCKRPIALKCGPKGKVLPLDYNFVSWLVESCLHQPVDVSLQRNIQRCKGLLLPKCCNFYCQRRLFFNSFYWHWKKSSYKAWKPKIACWSAITANSFQLITWWHSTSYTGMTNCSFACGSCQVRKFWVCAGSPDLRGINFNRYCKWRHTVVFRQCTERHNSSEIALQWCWHYRC